MAETRALLVMVHGSPKESANDDMYQVVEIVKSRGIFGIVKVGFMECNAPTIPEAITQCVDAGATHIIAVPYFLHVGTHVADDLPGLIEQAKESFPNVVFSMGRHIGESIFVTQILASRAASDEFSLER